MSWNCEVWSVIFCW